MPNVFSQPYQLNEFISNFRVVGGIFAFLFSFKNIILSTNCEEPDQTSRFATSDLVLQCLPMSHKNDAWLIWVKLL